MTHTELLNELVEVVNNAKKFVDCDDTRAVFLEGMGSGFETLCNLLSEGKDGKEIIWMVEAATMNFLGIEVEEDTEVRNYQVAPTVSRRQTSNLFRNKFREIIDIN